MKYSDTNPPIQCMMRNSTCYKSTYRMKVKGVLWHSTGANNPTIRRYVQPCDSDPNKSNLLNIIGVNRNRNDWNHIEKQAGLNCWIGKLADGSVSTVQTMPWDYRPWGCGGGKKGSCNDGWIQFEICEDGLNDAAYFAQIYQEACEITAYLCKKFNIDPNGTVTHNGVKVPTILCHQDSYKLGLGSGHADVLHWFPKFGKSMQTVRNDVAELICKAAEPAPPAAPIVKEEDEDMTLDKFKELMKEYRKELQDNDCGAWSKDAREWAVTTGLVNGMGTGKDGAPLYGWEDSLTREQMAVLLHRFAQMMGRV